jgi:glycosyltransferase involved in cell wall biosynthesis
MKVLVANWLSTRGGEEKHVIELVQYLARKPGVEVFLAAPKPCAWMPELEALPNLTYLETPFASKLDLKSVLRLMGHLRKYRFDVVHVHGARAGWLVRLAAVLAGYRKVVWTMQLMIQDHVSRQPGWSRRFYFAIEAFLNRRTAIIIAVSEDLRRRLLKAQPSIDPEHVVAIHNAVADPRPAAGRPARSPERKPAEIRCVAVGKLQREKGHDVLIEALAQLPPEARPQADIIGEGMLRGELEELIRSKGLQGTVNLLGFQRNPAGMLADYDIFVMPSRYEGIPLAMLEAMAMELPVVGTAVNGIPEAIVDGDNGLLVPAEAAPALADAVRRLAEDSQLRLRLGRKARQTYLDAFTGEHIYGKIHGIYARLAA